MMEKYLREVLWKCKQEQYSHPVIMLISKKIGKEYKLNTEGKHITNIKKVIVKKNLRKYLEKKLANIKNAIRLFFQVILGQGKDASVLEASNHTT